jgi:hypothetical protein
MEATPSETLRYIGALLHLLDNASGVSWGELEGSLRSWVERAGAVCKEVAEIAARLVPDISVHAGEVAGSYAELLRRSRKMTRGCSPEMVHRC